MLNPVKMKNNGIQILIFVVILLIAIPSCNHYWYNQRGYIRPPKNFRFEYQKLTQKLTSNAVIDTTCIYISKDNFIYYDSLGVIKKQMMRDNYIRFFSNGRFKQGSLRRLEEFPEDMNDINTGGIGLYLLKNQSVYLEFYSDINAGSSQLRYSEINEEGNLLIYRENPNSSLSPKFSKYYNPNSIKKSDFEIYKKDKNSHIKYVIPNW